MTRTGRSRALRAFVSSPHRLNQTEAIYRTSTERTAALDGWLWHYNHLRKHSALGHHPPITRVTNLLGTYT